MLLETIKSLVIRLKKHKSPIVQTELPDLITKSKPTLSDDANSGAVPPGASLSGRGVTLNSDSWPVEQLVPTVPTPDFFPDAQNCVINNPTMIAQTINSGGTGKSTFSPCQILISPPTSPPAPFPEENSWC